MTNNIECLNKTEETKILNAAITPWAGFIYQGLCALCVALEKLLDQPKANKWFLNIEGYEDFALLDENKQILSFHQCKNYKSKTSFVDEFKKMEDKRFYWNKEGKCTKEAPLYFHTPVSLTYTNNVTGYTYRDGTVTLSLRDADEKIKNLIFEYLQNNKIPGSSNHKHDELVYLVQNHVTSLDAESKKAKQNLGEMMNISVDRSLPFTRILDILNQTEDNYTIQDKIRTSVYYVNLWMNERINSNPTKQHDKVMNFLAALNNLDINTQERFIKRIFPDVDIEKGINVSTEISNSPRFDFLYNVLEATDDLDYEYLHWEQNGVRQTPSALGSNRTPNELCEKIVQNKHLPPELFRDYDWIVGDIKNSVDDIIETVHKIDNINGVNYDEITNPRKLGLHSIADKNNDKIY